MLQHAVVKRTFLTGNEPELNDRHVHNKQPSCFSWCYKVRTGRNVSILSSQLSPEQINSNIL